MPELREYQKEIVDGVPGKWGLWMKMRTGKSPTSIRLANRYAKSSLIICPKSITGHWEDEIKTWSISDCKFTVISKEQFRIKYQKIEPHEAIIWDECHTGGGNYKSQLHKNAMKYITHHNVKYIWLLTGTPATGQAWSVYSYAKLLGRDWNWYKFKMAFFDEVRLGAKPPPGCKDMRMRIQVPKKGKEKELQVLFKKLGTVLDFKDITEVIDDEDIIEEFNFNKKQEKIADDNYDVNPIVNYGRLHQIESGSLKSDGYTEDAIFKVEKDDRIKELCKGTDKIIIVARYKLQIKKYKELLSKLNKPILEIHGDIKETAYEVAKKAEALDKVILLCQGDTAAGYSLKSFTTMVFASMSYSFVNYEQMRFRIQATDKKEPNTYIHLITKGDSIDRAVYETVIKKQTFSIELFLKEYVKKKK